MNYALKHFTVLCGILFIFCLVVQPATGHEYDTYCFTEWAKHIDQFGLGAIYTSWSDYPPLYHYILKIYGAFAGNADGIERKIQFLKLITLIFHFITGYYVLLWTKKDQQTWDNALFKNLFYLFNIAILYNAIIWGQVDIILTCFLFLSCYYAYQKKIIPALIFFVLAINFKIQAIIFVPILALMLFPKVIQTFSIKRLLLWTIVPLFVQLIILLPFIISGTLDKLIDVLVNSFDKYPVVSMNAYNFWELVLSGNLKQQSDATLFLGLSYKIWGIILFFTASFIALFPLLKAALNSILSKTEFQISLDKFMIICALIPLLFFYFNTQMHERYSHPAFVFLTVYAIYQRRYILLALGSLAYILNLEDVLQFMQLRNYSTVFFDPHFIAILYLITILWLYSDLYIPGKRSDVSKTS